MFPLSLENAGPRMNTVESLSSQLVTSEAHPGRSPTSFPYWEERHGVYAAPVLNVYSGQARWVGRVCFPIALNQVGHKAQCYQGYCRDGTVSE